MAALFQAARTGLIALLLFAGIMCLLLGFAQIANDYRAGGSSSSSSGSSSNSKYSCQRTIEAEVRVRTPPYVVSIQFLAGCALLFGAFCLIRRRFSLRVLLIAMIAAGTLASIPARENNARTTTKIVVGVKISLPLRPGALEAIQQAFQAGELDARMPAEIKDTMPGFMSALQRNPLKVSRAQKPYRDSQLDGFDVTFEAHEEIAIHGRERVQDFLSFYLGYCLLKQIKPEAAKPPPDIFDSYWDSTKAARWRKEYESSAIQKD